ncbi:surface-adhesin E family protein [Nostoc sp.]|uniref:surface-adhesin E family protein n=1 Tax=Nostoc sp. TaxID=1180 RepID=UPI002FF6F842
MKSLLLGLVFVISAALPAKAENWVYVDATESDTKFSIDTESITEINGGYAFKELIVSERENKYLVGYSEILCKERANRSTGYESYTANGQFIQERHFPQSPFNKIIINTVRATLWEKLCN